MTSSLAACFTGALSRAPGEAAGTYAILQNSLALGPNYSLTYVGANLIITAPTGSIAGTVYTDTNGNSAFNPGVDTPLGGGPHDNGYLE